MLFCHERLRKLSSKFIAPLHHSCFSTATVIPPWTHLLQKETFSPQSLSQTKQAHAISLLHGQLPYSVTISAILITNYSLHGDILTSRYLFEQTLPFSRSAFLWNNLIRAYANLNDRDCLSVYNRMLRSGVHPDDHTFPCVIKACNDFKERRKGREVHALAVKSGFDRDVYVGNTILIFYSGAGDLKCVIQAFDEMPERDVVSWNTAIGVFGISSWCSMAIELYREMGESGFLPNLVTLVSILPACARVGNGTMMWATHCYAVKVGLDEVVKVGNALVDAYGKCGDVKGSRRVFDTMVERNVVSWNSLITAYSYKGNDKDALVMFRLMIDAGERPNSITISSMLPVLVELEYINMGREMHCFSIRVCKDCDVFIANSLIDMYAKSGRTVEANNVFNLMQIRNVVSWNAMIANFAQNNLELGAMGLLRQMQEHGEAPNSVSLVNILPACARRGFLRPGKEIHARALRLGSCCDLFISNALTDMYAKCNCLKRAQNVFDMSHRDDVSYNTLIVGYSQTIDSQKSLELFSDMGLVGLKHDVVSFVGVLSACANLNSLKQGKEIHGILLRKTYQKHIFVANSLLDLYTKCGRIDIAREIFTRMPKKDAASWNTLIVGYGNLGELETALDLFESMKEDGVQPDSVSYIAVLSTCSHGGLLQKGRKYFDELKATNIDPTQMHYACMVDLLGRAGLMKEVVDLINGLPFEPNANIWGALLGACRIHGNLELGSWAADHLFKLKPDHCGYYILLSNMYAEAGRWTEANRIRGMMKSRGVNKSPAYSWVQIRDQVHAFVVGERAHETDSYMWLAEFS